MNNYTCVRVDRRADCWSARVLAELQKEGILTQGELQNLIGRTETEQQRLQRLGPQ